MTRHNLNSWRTVFQALNVPIGNVLQAITPPVQVSTFADPCFAYRVRIENVGGAGAIDNVELRYFRQPGGPYNANPQAPGTPVGQAFVLGEQGPEDWIEVWAGSGAGTSVNVYLDRLTQSIPV